MITLPPGFPPSGYDRGPADLKDRPLCATAQEFSDDLNRLLAQLGEVPAAGKLARAELLLQRRWHQVRADTPAFHLRTARFDHRCVDEVYFATWQRLCELRQLDEEWLRLDDYPGLPAQRGLPAAEIAGIFIGEDLGAVEATP
jgi:hypothetical protein